MKKRLKELAIEHTISKLLELQENSTNKEDLHFYIANEDYYVVYYYDAEKFIVDAFGSAFDAIAYVVDYENDNFGEVSTDVTNSVSVANMVMYIACEELLNDCDLSDYDNSMTEENIQDLIDQLNEL